MATIQGVYVALFGRPADPTGLAYFNSVTNNGANLSGINNLSGTAEYQARFTGLNNVQIINSIYQSLFGRDADLTGLNFFADALAKGTLNINNIAIAILDGAQGNDKTIVTNKVAAADLYTKALDTGSEVVAYSGLAAAAQGRAFISGVSTTVPTAAAVDAAVATMVSAAGNGGTGTVGVTLTLANGADTVGPNTTTDATKTTAGNDTIRAVAAGDLGTADSIDGGAGTDTLNATLADSATAIVPVLKNVEIVNLTIPTVAAAGGLTGGIAFDASASTGIQQLNATGTLNSTTNANNAVSFANVDKATVVGVNGVNVINGQTGAVTVGYQNATGSTDAATIALSKANVSAANNGALTVKATGIETLTVQSNGSAATDTNKITLDVTDAITVKLTGSNGLALTEAGTLTKIKAIDASAMTGSLDLTLSGDHTSGFTVATGTAADAIKLGSSTTSDTLVYSNVAQSTIAKVDSITGFVFDGAGSDKIDLKAFNLGAATTVALTTLDSTGSDVPSMFSGTNKIVFNDTSDTLYVDVNGNGSFDATADLAVKFVGGITGSQVNISDFILA